MQPSDPPLPEPSRGPMRAFIAISAMLSLIGFFLNFILMMYASWWLGSAPLFCLFCAGMTACAFYMRWVTPRVVSNLNAALDELEEPDP